MSIRGELVYTEGALKSFDCLNEAESALVLSMRNHPDVARWMTTAGEIAPADHAAFMARQASDERNVNYLMRDGDGEIGVVGLHRIDTRNRLAFVGIYRNPLSSRKGLGSRLLQALCRLAFRDVLLHSLKLEVAADNGAAIRLYERHGFVHEGRWREAVRREKGFIDLVAMGLHEREWTDA